MLPDMDYKRYRIKAFPDQSTAIFDKTNEEWLSMFDDSSQGAKFAKWENQKNKRPK